jgi:hypothetical protein
MNILGVSAFGLKDRAYPCLSGTPQMDYCLSNLVLPISPLGKIQCGGDGVHERVHSGLYWPPNARVNKDTMLRRVPAALAWSLLVDAGDKPLRWKTEDGVSFPLATLLAAHIRKQLQHVTDTDKEYAQAVIAIPDHLDEYGQESLLQALKLDKSRTDFMLLWRPVAAAMAWLDKVKITEIHQDDRLLVIYLGPDAMEFTTFGLRKRNHGNKTFILPVRNRPSLEPGMTGWEWGCSLAEQVDLACANDLGALWQVLTFFPEIWASVAQIPWNKAELPRPWSISTGWRYWSPSPDLLETINTCPIAHSNNLPSLISRACLAVGTRRKSTAATWAEYLKEELDIAVKHHKGRVRGVVLCGPLMPSHPPKWLFASFPNILAKQEPHPDTIWIANDHQDPIAEGAQLFGKRLATGEPTYLDTLPSLALLTETLGKHIWVDIVETKECEGGQDYQNTIDDTFCLKGGTDTMEIYLKKERRKDPQNLAASDLSLSPYRHGNVPFPAIPKVDVPLKVEVKMRPASGLAKVNFTPHNEDFMMGQSVSFDYSQMLPIFKTELPEPAVGWPEDLHFEVTSNKEAFNDHNILNFLTSYLSSDFISRLDAMKKSLCSSYPEWKQGQQVFKKKIDENGKAGSSYGNEVILKIQNRIDKESEKFLGKLFSDDQTRIFVVRSTWLWGGTPCSVVKYLENYFNSYQCNTYDQKWNHYVESASRCFTNQKQYILLFNSILKRSKIHEVSGFPIQSARSISRILAYRKDGWTGLTEAMAINFIIRSIEIVDFEVHESKKIKQKFFQGALLFLVLLKYRMADSKFMDPNNRITKMQFTKMESNLRKAIEIGRNNYEGNVIAADRIEKLINGVIEFMYYRGKSGIISMLDSEAGGN